MISKEVVAAVQDFYDQGNFEKSINATLVSSTLKKNGSLGVERLQAHQFDRQYL